MNVYALVILAALLVDYGLGLLADVLNLRALYPEVPPDLRQAYAAERYRRSQEYTRVQTRLGIVAATLDLALLLGFWFAGGFAWLDRAVRGLCLGPIATGLLFVGALGLARMAVALPLRWWATFVVEERFGFNRTTPRTFWTDALKGLALAVVLGTPLLALVLWLFAWAGAAAWLWCWAATTAFLLGVQLVAPTWILPLFNEFTPLAEGPLREAILAYARAVAVPLADVFVVDGSRRSTKANAFFTGFGRTKRVALFDTLVEKLATDEVVAVLAHEIGHYERRHVVKGLALGVVRAGVVFFLLSVFLEHPGLFAAFGVAERSTHAGLVFFALLFAPIDLGLSLAVNALSRRHEYQADAFAAATTGMGARLASALARLAADALANPTPHPLYVVLHHSHPPLRARLRALGAAAEPT